MKERCLLHTQFRIIVSAVSTNHIIVLGKAMADLSFGFHMKQLKPANRGSPREQQFPQISVNLEALQPRRSTIKDGLTGFIIVLNLDIARPKQIIRRLTAIG